MRVEVAKLRSLKSDLEKDLMDLKIHSAIEDELNNFWRLVATGRVAFANISAHWRLRFIVKIV